VGGVEVGSRGRCVALGRAHRVGLVGGAPGEAPVRRAGERGTQAVLELGKVPRPIVERQRLPHRWFDAQRRRVPHAGEKLGDQQAQIFDPFPQRRHGDPGGKERCEDIGADGRRASFGRWDRAEHARGAPSRVRFEGEDQGALPLAAQRVDPIEEDGSASGTREGRFDGLSRTLPRLGAPDADERAAPVHAAVEVARERFLSAPGLADEEDPRSRARGVESLLHADLEGVAEGDDFAGLASLRLPIGRRFARSLRHLGRAEQEEGVAELQNVAIDERRAGDAPPSEVGPVP
jgi:hypothetical protein